jgi:hypothetical protein
LGPSETSGLQGLAVNKIENYLTGLNAKKELYNQTHM